MWPEKTTFPVSKLASFAPSTVLNVSPKGDYSPDSKIGPKRAWPVRIQSLIYSALLLWKEQQFLGNLTDLHDRKQYVIIISVHSQKHKRCMSVPVLLQSTEDIR